MREFTQSGHRLITPEHHPKNIAVITAPNMAAAIPLADHALRRDGIQGVVWYREPDPDRNEHAFRLFKVFRERAKLPEDPEKFFKGPKTASLQHGEISWARDGLQERFHLTDSLAPQIVNDIFHSFSVENVRVKHTLRAENRGSINMHVDGFLNGYTLNVARPDLLFQGFYTSAILSQTVAGTLIAETDKSGAPALVRLSKGRFKIDRSLAPQLWALGLNSWLFFHPLSTAFGTAKTLVHSFPQFDIGKLSDIGPENPPRIFHRCDFTPG